jgi:hypothetical protein
MRWAGYNKAKALLRTHMKGRKRRGTPAKGREEERED